MEIWETILYPILTLLVGVIGGVIVPFILSREERKDQAALKTLAEIRDLLDPGHPALESIDEAIATRSANLAFREYGHREVKGAGLEGLARCLAGLMTLVLGLVILISIIWFAMALFGITAPGWYGLFAQIAGIGFVVIVLIGIYQIWNERLQMRKWRESFRDKASTFARASRKQSVSEVH